MDSIHDEPVINNPNIVDLSKYTDDQQRVIKMLLDSFDSAKFQENKQEKPLTTETENVRGGGETRDQPEPKQPWKGKDRRIIDRRNSFHAMISDTCDKSNWKDL